MVLATLQELEGSPDERGGDVPVEEAPVRLRASGVDVGDDHQADVVADVVEDGGSRERFLGAQMRNEVPEIGLYRAKGKIIEIEEPGPSIAIHEQLTHVKIAVKGGPELRGPTHGLEVDHQRVGPLRERERRGRGRSGRERGQARPDPAPRIELLEGEPLGSDLVKANQGT